MIKNSRSLPRELSLFGQKMAGKPRFYCRTSPEKLQFTDNNGYGLIGIGMLSSKLVELTGKIRWRWPKNGQNHHSCSNSLAAYRSRLPPSSDETPDVWSLAAAIPLGPTRVLWGCLVDYKNGCSRGRRQWRDEKERSRKREREKDMYIYTFIFFFPYQIAISPCL